MQAIKAQGEASIGDEIKKGTTDSLINLFPKDRLILVRPLSPEDHIKIAENKLDELKAKFLRARGDYGRLT